MKPVTLGYVAAAVGVGVMVYLLARQSRGLLTGDNSITRSATNAAGEPVTAYQGQGVIGTVGAATNAASGGVLASVGQWIGGKVADVTDWVNGVDPTTATPLPETGTQKQYQNAGTLGSNGAGQLDSWADYVGSQDPFGLGVGGTWGNAPL